MSDKILKQLGINNARIDYHNNRLDSAFDGTYLRRLPDRTLDPANEYEQWLEEYRKHENKN